MNKNVKLSTLAALGLIAGTMHGAHTAPPPTTSTPCEPATTAQIQDLFAQLDTRHQEMFNGMDCETQNLAVEMAEQKCAGKNKCAGRNSCRTKEHSCMGKGACQGTSPGPFKDKNKAVDVARKMAQRRMNTMGQ